MVRSGLFIKECYVVHTIDHKSSSLECHNTKSEKILKNISSMWQEVLGKKTQTQTKTTSMHKHHSKTRQAIRKT